MVRQAVIAVNASRINNRHGIAIPVAAPLTASTLMLLLPRYCRTKAATAFASLNWGVSRLFLCSAAGLLPPPSDHAGDLRLPCLRPLAREHVADSLLKVAARGRCA